MGSTTYGRSDAAAAYSRVNVKRPVHHTIKTGDGPAVPVPQGPSYIDPGMNDRPIVHKGKK